MAGVAGVVVVAAAAVGLFFPLFNLLALSVLPVYLTVSVLIVHYAYKEGYFLFHSFLNQIHENPIGESTECDPKCPGSNPG